MKRPHVQAIWATAEYIAYPLLMFSVTPFVLSSIGQRGYGQWVLVLAASGFGGVAGLGMGAATTKAVSAAKGGNNPESIRRTVRESLGVAAAGSVALGLIVMALASFLPAQFLNRIGGRHDAFAIAVAVVILVSADQVDTIYSGVLKGAGRFDLASRVDIAMRILTILCIAAALIFSAHLWAAILGSIFGGFMRAASKMFLVRRAFGVRFVLPRFPSRLRGGGLASFGAWVWLQSVGSALFSSVDRIVLGLWLGPESVAQYAVTVQLVQQVHAIPAAASAVVFPMVSAGTTSRVGVLRDALRHTAIVAVVACALAALAILYGRYAIELWLSSSHLVPDQRVIVVLAGSYVVLAMSAVPHYTLYGLGEPKTVAVANLAAGLSALFVAVLAIPGMGQMGGALSKCTYAVVVVALLVAGLLTKR